VWWELETPREAFPRKLTEEALLDLYLRLVEAMT
jgi:hypothetical protein